MTIATDPSRLFGLNLAPLRQATTAAWRGLLSWPVFSWLSPTLPVCLWTPSGQTFISHGPDTAAIASESAAKKARFSALLLPEQVVLRKALDLPPLSPDQCMEALKLAAATLSPFPPADLVWTQEPAKGRSQPHAAIRHHLVLASRKIIAQHIANTHPGLNPALLEIWVPCAGSHHLLLPGFGEGARIRRNRAWQMVSATLGLLALAMLLAMALTPTAQLYLRTVQANQASAALGVKAGPVIAERDKMLQSVSQLATLKEKIGTPVLPARVLKLLTEALPDDTSLLSLQIQELKVSMSGQTVDATALMKRLDATPGLRNITAPNPTVKPLGATRESFSIELTLDPKHIN